MFKLLRSLGKSLGKAIYNDPELQRIFRKYPRFSHFVKKRLTPDEEFGLILTVGSLITFLFIYFFFQIVQDLIGQGALLQSDLRVLNLFQILRTPAFNEKMLFITYLAHWQVVFLGVLLVGILFLLARRWHYFVTLVISVGAGEAFVWFLKLFVHRSRPPLINALVQETTYSFPSGHSFVAISFYGLLTYFVFRAVKGKLWKFLAILPGFFLILAIGFSRIYLGAHWPSDVLASYASGASWLAVLITSLEIRRRFWPRKPVENPIHKAWLCALGVVFFSAWLGFVFYFFSNHPLAPSPAQVTLPETVISESQIPDVLFETLPRTSEDLKGTPMEPINIIVVGTQDRLDQAFETAGWMLTDPITAKSIWHMTIATILNQSYASAPGIPSFWDTYPNDFAFEKLGDQNSVRERNHIHFWETPFSLGNEVRVWFGTAHFDQGIKLMSSVILPTHVIDPAVDEERDKVKEDLVATGFVDHVQEFQIVDPQLGNNEAGDLFFTDGKSVILFLDVL